MAFKIPSLIPKKFKPFIVDIEKLDPSEYHKLCYWTKGISNDGAHQAYGRNLKEIILELECMSECHCDECK